MVKLAGWMVWIGLVISLILTGCGSSDSDTNGDNAPIVGAYSDANISDPEVIAAANFAVSQMNEGSLVQIVSAKTQVVAGTNYKLELLLSDGLTYEAVVYKDLQGNMQLLNKAPVTGGYSDADVNDPDVIAAANFAVSQMNEGSLVQIVSAKTQVVAGTNYKLELLLSDGLTYEVIVYKDLQGNLSLISKSPKTATT